MSSSQPVLEKKVGESIENKGTPARSQCPYEFMFVKTA